MENLRFSRDEELETADHNVPDFYLDLSVINQFERSFQESNYFHNNQPVLRTPVAMKNKQQTNISPIKTDNDSYHFIDSYNYRTNRMFSKSSPSSPSTDIEERRSSPSVPISPINNQMHKRYDHDKSIRIQEQLREEAEISQLEIELQCKTLEMLALIKGTTPAEAYVVEKLEEIRSQRARSTDIEDADALDSDDYNDDHYERLGNSLSKDNVLLSFNSSFKKSIDKEEYLIGESYADEEEENFQTQIIKEIYEDSDEEEDIFGMEL